MAKENLDAARRKTIDRKVWDELKKRFVTFSYKDDTAVAAAQEKVEASQVRLEQFEEEARRNNIPAGWLRCDKR